MSYKTYTYIYAKKHFFHLMQMANYEKKAVIISSSINSEKDAVLVGQDEWNSIQETLYLINTDVFHQVKNRKNDSNENFDDVWNQL